MTVTSSSRDHLIPRRPFPIDGFLEASISITVSEIVNVECQAMVDVTLLRPRNKDQDHSFW